MSIVIGNTATNCSFILRTTGNSEKSTTIVNWRTWLDERGYIMFAIPAGTGTVLQRLTWSRKAPGFGWATFGRASCIIVQQSSSPSSYPTSPPNFDFRVIDLVSSPVWWEAVTNIGYMMYRGDWIVLSIIRVSQAIVQWIFVWKSLNINNTPPLSVLYGLRTCDRYFSVHIRWPFFV